jgi:hypothetical protein
MFKFYQIYEFPKYEVSECGIVREIKTGKILNPDIKKFKEKNRHIYLSLVGRDYIIRTVGVHRCVALTFIPNPDELPVVNHIDGVKWNNHVSNLEWLSQKYNHIHFLKIKKVGVIHWNEYKELRKIAEDCIKNRIFENEDVQIEIYSLELNRISKEQCVENLINIFSKGEHFKPL